VPMLALLVGVVVRGAAFTFRHYDPVQTPRSQRVYTWLFGLSSLWTALWLGVIAASLNRGHISLHATSGWDAYFAPWWGWYPLAVGIFIVCIFTFLAAVYLIGETGEVALRQRFQRLAAAGNVLVILSGGFVFLTSLGEREPLPAAFRAQPLTLGVVALATALFVALWLFVVNRHPWLTRAAAAGQAALILVGWCLLYAPNALVTREGPMSFYEQAAPPATLEQLVLALVIGSAFIFPGLYYLLRVFKLGHQPGQPTP